MAKTYKLLTEDVTDGDNFSNSHCWVEEISENEINLIIVGGGNFDQTPNYYQYNLTIDLTKLEIVDNKPNYSDDPRCLIKEYSTLVRFGDKSLVIGGAFFSLYMINPILIYDHKNFECEYLDYLEDIVLYGHSAVHYKKSIIIFGGGGVIKYIASIMKIYNNLYKLSFSNEDLIKPTCSEGSIGIDCRLCRKGTYFDKGKCIECPAGTHNEVVGSTNLDQCIPCEYGTFTNKTGSVLCYDCLTSFYCPIGSSIPKSHLITTQNKTVQPSEYKSQKTFVSNINSTLWYGFSLIFIIFLVLSVKFTPIYNFLQNRDIFVESHDKKLNIPVVYIKTRIGGTFSIAFILASLITIAVSALNFYYDNIIEIRGTVPVILLEDKVVSKDFYLNFTFYTYGGKCLERGKCHSRISSELKGLEYDSNTFTCHKFGDNCIIEIQIKNAYLTTKQPQITISLKEYQSYASALSINISSSSSIPNQISSVFTYIQAPTNEKVFKGITSSMFCSDILFDLGIEFELELNLKLLFFLLF